MKSGCRPPNTLLRRATANLRKNLPYLDFVELIVRQFNQVFRTGPSSLSASASGQVLPGDVHDHDNYRKADVDGLKVFYREAGRADAPTLLLLHGFPTSTHMFRDLIPLLADRFHSLRPTCPASGSVGHPDEQFAYTFDHFAM